MDFFGQSEDFAFWLSNCMLRYNCSVYCMFVQFGSRAERLSDRSYRETPEGQNNGEKVFQTRNGMLTCS